MDIEMNVKTVLHKIMIKTNVLPQNFKTQMQNESENKI